MTLESLKSKIAESRKPMMTMDSLRSSIKAANQLEKLKNALEKNDGPPYPRAVPVMFRGLKILIENPVGSVRRGVDSDGHKWETRMKAAYGRAAHSLGNDGE